tara:strand:- start:60 stop:329 length:270 start_codon:yes stop_codon:yes gene_type:complete
VAGWLATVRVLIDELFGFDHISHEYIYVLLQAIVPVSMSKKKEWAVIALKCLEDLYTQDKGMNGTLEAIQETLRLLKVCCCLSLENILS